VLAKDLALEFPVPFLCFLLRVLPFFLFILSSPTSPQSFWIAGLRRARLVGNLWTKDSENRKHDFFGKQVHGSSSEMTTTSGCLVEYEAFGRFDDDDDDDEDACAPLSASRILF